MRKSTLLYRSGTDTIDITQPGGIDRLLDFHRATFGNARMEGNEDGSDGGDGGNGGGTNGQPAAGGQGGTDGASDGKFKDPDTGKIWDFPADTPTAEMTEAQRSEYWRHKAQKHENRYRAIGDVEKLRSASAELARIKRDGLSDADKAIADARDEAATEARADERGKFAAQLVSAEFRAAAGGRLPADRMKGLLEGIDPTKFLTSEGQVDTDKVQQYVDGIAPAGTQWPDMGQGRGRGSENSKASVSSVKDDYLASKKKKA